MVIVLCNHRFFNGGILLQIPIDIIGVYDIILVIREKRAPERSGDGNMMISSKGRYALRVMLDMAEQHSDENIRLKDIADRQNISRKYLESIMTVLCKNNLVKSSIGKDGGYRLMRPPDKYTAGEILQAVEGELVPVACLAKDSKKCSGVCTCYTLPFWEGLEEQINSYVNSYTLKDLLGAKENTPDCHCGTGAEKIEKKDMKYEK